MFDLIKLALRRKRSDADYRAMQEHIAQAVVEEMKKKDMAAKSTSHKQRKQKKFTEGAHQAEPAQPSPDEYRGKYHGLNTALEVLHMADVQESFLNVLVTHGDFVKSGRDQHHAALLE